MAEDDQERAREAEAEREAEIESELERVGQDPDQVDAGSENLGRQSADSGTPREEPAEDDVALPPDEAESGESTDEEDVEGAAEVPEDDEEDVEGAEGESEAEQESEAEEG